MGTAALGNASSRAMASLPVWIDLWGWESSMVRSDIAEDYPGLSQIEIEKIVETFFGSIVGQLNAGGRVELRGFGSFPVRSYDARAGRNPRTGETVAVEVKNRPHFKPGKQMLARLNGEN